jgi:hypothetical protein
MSVSPLLVVSACIVLLELLGYDILVRGVDVELKVIVGVTVVVT